MRDNVREMPLSVKLEYLRTRASTITGGSTEFKDAFLKGIDMFNSGENRQELPLLLSLRRYPVDFEQFMFDPMFLGRPRVEIYPAVLEECTKINNAGGSRVTNPYTEAVFTGGIGSAKTTSALYTCAYQTYVLSCFKDPRRTFGMDSTSEILIVFQSLSGSHAQEVDYTRFREICEQSHYFRSVFPFNKRLTKQLKFPGRVEVRAIGTDTGAIGQNVIGGLIDELNFMTITKDSAKNKGGTYNQALTIYNGISRRRKSRFISSGAMPGILCLVSSKRYPGEFTDKKIEEAVTDPTIYIYDKRVWDIKPKGTFTSGSFRMFTGDLTRKARILEDSDLVPSKDSDLVVKVPVEFLKDFQDDPIGSLRDIAGIGTLARYPYIMNNAKVSEAFGFHESIFTHQTTDFSDGELGIIMDNLQYKERARWAHIDLGVTNDACGLAIGCVPSFAAIKRSTDEIEMLPNIHVDGLLRITPPHGDEILFYKIRDILYVLRDNGINIKWVSFDQFQSVDSIQILQRKGFLAGRQSVDITMEPYDHTKLAIYDGRLKAPIHSTCMVELLSLERDIKKGKIDHPPEGSKDVSDGLAGVVSGLTTRRETWTDHGVPIRDFERKLLREKQHASKEKG